MIRWDARTLQNALIAFYLFPLVLFVGFVAWSAKSALSERADASARDEAALRALASCRAELDGILAPNNAKPLPDRLLALRRAAEKLEHASVFQGSVQDLLEAGTGVVRAAAHENGSSDSAKPRRDDLRMRLADASSALTALEADARKRVLAGERLFSRSIRSILLLCAAFLGFTILYACASVALIVGNQSRSLNELGRGTLALRNGNLDFRFHRITADQCGQVMNDFNEMARKLKEQTIELNGAVRSLREHAERLIEARQHKDRFLANMSHELRTPLNSIIGFSELLEMRAQTASPERIRTHAGRILKAAEHLLALITSILDLAKSDAGTLKPVPARFNLSAAIAESAELLRPLAEKKGLLVRIDVEPDVMVEADQRMLRQIFFNLFGNAVKYTERGSVSVSLARKDGSAILDVADTGIGIREEEKENIFKDFYRIDNGPDHLTDGVGIGLVLSRRLAALNRAKISFRSEYGVGSVFTATIPALPQEPESEPPTASNATS